MRSVIFRGDYKRFLKIWELPHYEELTEPQGEQEQDIFDADEPRHKKLEYFIFDNTKVETDAIAQMYMYVLRELYNINTQLLTSNQNVVKITRHIDDFRSGQEVANGWFVETNLDSTAKVNYLKKLLTLYEYEDELIVKYSDELVGKGIPNRHLVRNRYWQQILPKLDGSDLFKQVSSGKEHWLSTGAGITGLSYTLLISKSFCRIELSFVSSSKELNKKHFHKLLKHREEIESAFGNVLVWEELPDNKMCRIKYENNNVNLFNTSDWDDMNSFFIEHLPKFEAAFKVHIKSLKNN